MNNIEKLLKKISKKDREKLLEIIKRLLSGDKKLKSIKIKNSDFYRLRYGDYRIIFHKESGILVIDSIRMRGDNTYKNLNL
ncbi:MAG: type II toxin-antitoxin system RelE/ParE family toxin [Patescibacteria group bacterium]|jgi:mRNA-degrading endonuclease RelE of RelBE toxin-antitoxin system|nr:type II toxin-antitoxin system RelE/ParE family toxin [Patescibacteria group bacterium]